MDAMTTPTATPTTRRSLLARLGAGLAAALAPTLAPGRAGADADPALGRVPPGRRVPDRIRDDTDPSYRHGVFAVWQDELQGSTCNAVSTADAARLRADHFDIPEPAWDGGRRARDYALWRDGRLVGAVRVGKGGRPIITLFED